MEESVMGQVVGLGNCLLISQLFLENVGFVGVSGVVWLYDWFFKILMQRFGQDRVEKLQYYFFIL